MLELYENIRSIWPISSPNRLEIIYGLFVLELLRTFLKESIKELLGKLRFLLYLQFN